MTQHWSLDISSWVGGCGESVGSDGPGGSCGSRDYSWASEWWPNIAMHWSLDTGLPTILLRVGWETWLVIAGPLNGDPTWWHWTCPSFSAHIGSSEGSLLTQGRRNKWKKAQSLNLPEKKGVKSDEFREGLPADAGNSSSAVSAVGVVVARTAKRIVT